MSDEEIKDLKLMMKTIKSIYANANLKINTDVDLKSVKSKYLKRAYSWAQNFILEVAPGYNKVRSLLSDDMWKKYHSFGYFESNSTMQEIVLMVPQIEKVKRLKIPIIFSPYNHSDSAYKVSK